MKYIDYSRREQEAILRIKINGYDPRIDLFMFIHRYIYICTYVDFHVAANVEWDNCRSLIASFEFLRVNVKLLLSASVLKRQSTYMHIRTLQRNISNLARARVYVSM